jgi:transposase
MMILAIDLAKAKSLFCWYQVADGSCRWRTLASTPDAFEQALTEQKVDRVVIEVCDMAGWIQDLCQKLQIPLQIANGNSQGWRWRNVKNKTDKTDTLKLVSLSLTNQLPLVNLPDRPTRQWKALILYRQKLIERRTQVKNRIHAILVAEGHAMRAGREAWRGECLMRLKSQAKPLADCQKDELCKGVLQMELESLDHLSQQIDALDEKLNALGEADERVQRLQTIPGVGPRLSELVVAVIDDPHRFKSVRQVSAYAGLTPRRYQSGQMDRNGRISKAGCGKLRKLLLEVAWGMLQHNGHGRSVFQRISKGQKTRRKQAAVALGRRVLGWCWAMLRDETDWRDPALAGAVALADAAAPAGAAAPADAAALAGAAAVT